MKTSGAGRTPFFGGRSVSGGFNGCDGLQPSWIRTAAGTWKRRCSRITQRGHGLPFAAMALPPYRVDYLPSIDRPIVHWPDDARVAFWVAPNVEHYEYLPPR